MKNKKIIVIILLTLLMIICIFGANIVRKMVLFGRIEEKMEEYNNCKNYYVKINNANGDIQEYFCKDNKEQIILTNNINGENVRITKYYNGLETTICTETSNDRNIRKENSNKVEPPIIFSLGFKNSWYWIKIAMNTKIKEIKIDGKNYYYIDGSFLKDTYIDKDTGLILENEKLKYEYEFNKVQESDFYDMK